MGVAYHGELLRLVRGGPDRPAANPAASPTASWKPQGLQAAGHRGPGPLPAARALRRRARDPHHDHGDLAERGSPSPTRSRAGGNRGGRWRPARRPRRRGRRRGRPRRLPEELRRVLREGRGHRRGRLHRLAPGGRGCWPTATRSWASTLSSDYYPRAVKEAQPRGQPGTCGPSAWSRAGCRTWTSSRSWRAPTQVFHLARPGGGAGFLGTRVRASTRTTTSWPRSGCWRPRRRSGRPRLVYASSSSVYGDCPGPPPARGLPLPPGLALRRHEAGSGAPRSPLRTNSACPW